MMRWRWWWPGHATLAHAWLRRRTAAVAVVAGALALAGCQNATDEAPVAVQSTPAETATAPAEAPPSTGYPPLQSVPPRPQLSYTVQQQRQIVAALVADRENARYTSQVVRYRSGLSSLPPPPAPPEKVAVALPVVEANEPAVAAPSLTDQETLIDFLASLRRKMFVAEPEPAAVQPPAPEALAPSAEQAVVPARADRPDHRELPAAQAVLPTAQQIGAPMPPARSAVAARMAMRPQPIDQLLDDSVAQAPLPPGRTAVVARQEAPQLVGTPPAAPVPAPRPAVILTTVALPSARPLVPAPPPIKPTVPVRSADDRSATLLRSGQSGANSRTSTRKRMIVADVAT